MTSTPVALVTGSRRGIGRTIALTLARDGYDIVVNDIERDTNADQTLSDIQALGREALWAAADLGRPPAIETLFAKIESHFGRLDVLVNNAATWTWAEFEAIAEAEWDTMLSVNLKAPFLCGQAAARLMRAQGQGGAMVNISSVHRARVWPQDTVYGVCKAAIVRLTESMAFELGPHGIRVNAIAPGYIDSRVPNPNEPPIGQPRYAAQVVPETPLRRIGLPEDIAEAAAFLVSERASFITGQCLLVDGGVMLGGAPV